MRNLLSPIYKLYEKKLWRQIKGGNFPKHIAIIMDGNRRYARKLNFTNVSKGHELGAKHLKNVLKWVYEANVEVLTLYAFSSENFNRPQKEVERLMELFRKKFLQIMKEPMIHKKEVKIRAIGRMSLLPADVRKAIDKAEKATKDYDKKILQIAIGYGGRMEMIDAVKSIAKEVKENKIGVDDISEEYFEKHLYTSGAPDPDLLIRTSGEERLSGFLLWQSAYSELYFADVFFPAFRKIDLWRAIRTYQERERRYGE